MKYTNIYQTLEDRKNVNEIEAHGPYFCTIRDAEDQIKTGVKTPWLGEGYYFWDSRKEDAHWWGKTVYCKNGKGYVVCETTYDAHSPFLYDLVGDLTAFDEFVEIANRIKNKWHLRHISFPIVIEYLKRHTTFEYKAIRVCPVLTHNKTKIHFPHQKNRPTVFLEQMEKVQLCFFDRTLLRRPFKVIEVYSYDNNYTI
ncbi:MAG: hypothetical protein ACFNVH_04205 [Segatella maculosa]